MEETWRRQVRNLPKSKQCVVWGIICLPSSSADICFFLKTPVFYITKSLVHKWIFLQGSTKSHPNTAFQVGGWVWWLCFPLSFWEGKKQRQMLQLRSGSLPEAVALVWLSEGACLSSSVFPSPFPLCWPGKAVYLIPSQCLSLLPCCSLEKEWAHHRNLLLLCPVCD